MVDKQQVATSALIGCKLGGCTCNPDIEVTMDEYGLWHAFCEHEDECPHAVDDETKEEAKLRWLGM